MVHTLEIKNKAIDLRKRGLVYSEILAQIPVAKSTLSEWLKDVGLAKAQKQRITAKRIAGQQKGARARREQRIELQKKIYAQSALEIGKLTEREKWLIGSVLYWGEGAKEKEWRPGNPAQFMNSDPTMIKFFISWLTSYCATGRNDICFALHIHENCKNRIEEVKKYWSKQTGFPVSNFNEIYYKKHIIKTKRKNIGDLYYGCLKVKVKGSSRLLRRITGWNMAIANSILSSSGF